MEELENCEAHRGNLPSALSGAGAFVLNAIGKLAQAWENVKPFSGILVPKKIILKIAKFGF